MEFPVFHLEKVVKAKEENKEDFLGPLDLILHLLSKNKMEIRDIQISVILDQYMDWIKQREQLDLEVASEFVAMASHLVYIKTRMLLSIHDEEAVSEMEQLIASLEERKRHENYQFIKAVIPRLEAYYAIGRDYIPKRPEPLPSNKTYQYSHSVLDLTQTMQQVLDRVGYELPPPMSAFQGIVGKEPYPVGDKATEILQHLLRLGIARFRSLFAGNRSRSEIVATFIAVLELCKAKRVSLAGTEEDCTITCTGGDESYEQVVTDLY